MRLIDADELRGRIIAFSTGCNTTYLTVANIVMMINQADTVDAVPVVRCRECENWKPYGSKAARKLGDPLERYGGCEIWHGGHLESDFCSYVKIREVGE
jgi:hypothetical protein|nr:MAG TPA: hypothetical protein [Caudoviricetes sp.]